MSRSRSKRASRPSDQIMEWAKAALGPERPSNSTDWANFRALMRAVVAEALDPRGLKMFLPAPGDAADSRSKDLQAAASYIKSADRLLAKPGLALLVIGSRMQHYPHLPGFFASVREIGPHVGAYHFMLLANLSSFSPERAYKDRDALFGMPQHVARAIAHSSDISLEPLGDGTYEIVGDSTELYRKISERLRMQSGQKCVSIIGSNDIAYLDVNAFNALDAIEAFAQDLSQLEVMRFDSDKGRWSIPIHMAERMDGKSWSQLGRPPIGAMLGSAVSDMAGLAGAAAAYAGVDGREVNRCISEIRAITKERIGAPPHISELLLTLGVYARVNRSLPSSESIRVYAAALEYFGTAPKTSNTKSHRITSLTDPPKGALRVLAHSKEPHFAGLITVAAEASKARGSDLTSTEIKELGDRLRQYVAHDDIATLVSAQWLPNACKEALIELDALTAVAPLLRNGKVPLGVARNLVVTSDMPKLGGTPAEARDAQRTVAIAVAAHFAEQSPFTVRHDIRRWRSDVTRSKAGAPQYADIGTVVALHTLAFGQMPSEKRMALVRAVVESQAPVTQTYERAVPALAGVVNAPDDAIENIWRDAGLRSPRLPNNDPVLFTSNQTQFIAESFRSIAFSRSEPAGVEL